MLREVSDRAETLIDCDVRVTGFVEYVDATKRLCQISHEGCTLFVDLGVVDMNGLTVGALFQFIGRLQYSAQSSGSTGVGPHTDGIVPTGAMYLMAVVKRNVDGLDLVLFEKSLQLRRQFLAKQLQQQQQQQQQQEKS